MHFAEPFRRFSMLPAALYAAAPRNKFGPEKGLPKKSILTGNTAATGPTMRAQYGEPVSTTRSYTGVVNPEGTEIFRKYSSEISHRIKRGTSRLFIADARIIPARPTRSDVGPKPTAGISTSVMTHKKAVVAA